MKIKVKALFRSSILPVRTNPGDSAFDLFACLNRNEIVEYGERKSIPCGIAIEMPPGYGLFIVPRTGLSVKHGITVHNSPSLVDSNYRGEVRVIVHNDMQETFFVFPKARIAQCVVLPLPDVEWEEVDDIPKNYRETAYV